MFSIEELFKEWEEKMPELINKLQNKLIDESLVHLDRSEVVEFKKLWGKMKL